MSASESPETTKCKGRCGACKNNAQFDGLCYFCHTAKPAPEQHTSEDCDLGGCTRCANGARYSGSAL